MPAAGETIIAGRVPGERIATAIRTASSVSFTTTETVLDTVVAAVVDGRTYRVSWSVDLASTVTDDVARIRIREDSLTGQVLNLTNIVCRAGRDIGFTLEAEYTADATEDKTLVATCHRQDGTGTLTSNALSSEPIYLYVDYIRG